MMKNKNKKRFSTQYSVGFFKKMAFLLDANIPLNESLQIITEESSNYKSLVQKILTEIENGKKLFESLSFTNSFTDKSCLELIRSGEENGMLSRNLATCSVMLQKREENKNTIMVAMLYPLIILFGTLGLSWFLIGFIFPKIKTVLLSMNANLPTSTKILIAISDFISKYWIQIIFLIIFISLFIVFIIRKYYAVKKFLHKLFLKIPIISGIINANEYSRVYSSISTILTSGGKLDRAIGFAKENTQNVLHTEGWKQIFLEIGHGKSLHVAMENKVFPTFDIGFIKSAERSGKLPEALAELSQMHENNLKNSISKLTKLFEPIMMVFLGCIVGFVAISIISPMYEITQNIGQR